MATYLQVQDILNVSVSCFANYNTPGNPKSINLYAWLTNTKYQAKVEMIRQLTDKLQRDELKATLPAITPSGVFTYRQASCLVPGGHSRLIQFDIDFKDNPHIRNYADLKAQIAKLPFVVYCGLSVSGTGYWGLVLIAHPERHGQHFDALKRVFAHYRIILDEKPRNVASLRGYSYDPAGYFAERVLLFELYDEPVKPPVRTLSHTIDADEERTRVEACVSEISRRGIDITSGYNYWYAIGCDLASTFGESGREYFHVISQIHPGYNSANCDKQYTHCLRSYKDVQLKAFFGRCRDNGISWKELIPFTPNESPERTAPLKINQKTAIQPTYKTYKTPAPLPATNPEDSTRIQPSVIPVDMVTVVVNALDDWAANPGSILRPEECQMERLTVEPVDSYPAEWDEPNLVGAVPQIKQQTFFEWQRSQESPFNKLGLASLSPKQQS